MNAKEALQLCDVSGGPVEVVLYPAGEFAETILRALRLLAAAEANDGSTPETDACADWNARCERIGDNEIITHGLMLALAHDEGDELRLLARRLERERNALAARVRELEKDASVSGGVAPVSAEVKTAAGGSPAPNINEAMLLLAEVEPHLDEWNFPITLQDRVTAACNAYFGEVRPFLDAARSK